MASKIYGTIGSTFYPGQIVSPIMPKLFILQPLAAHNLAGLGHLSTEF